MSIYHILNGNLVTESMLWENWNSFWIENLHRHLYFGSLELSQSTQILYGTTVHNIKQMNLRKIQIEVAWIVTGATRLASLNLLYTETGWETLASRRVKYKFIMFYKMRYSLCPTSLRSLVPPKTGANVAYNLRNQNNIQTAHAYSHLYFNSFLPSVIRSWNELPGIIRNSNNTTALKRCLNTDLHLPPDIIK